MSHRILITGASGYLGGTLLARLSKDGLPPYAGLYALVRNQSQADAVKQYGAEPLIFNPYNEAAVRDSIIENRITVVYFLIDALHSEAQAYFIRALTEVKKQTKQEVHFLHVG